jgi:hypothetical protein
VEVCDEGAVELNGLLEERYTLCLLESDVNYDVLCESACLFSARLISRGMMSRRKWDSVDLRSQNQSGLKGSDRANRADEWESVMDSLCRF